jgi:hypothetical protein
MEQQERRERIIKVVHDIEMLRTKLRAFETELDALLGPSPQISKPALAKGAPLADRIVAFLKVNPGAWDAERMVGPLGIKREQVNNLRAELSRLAKAGRIERESRGKYRVASPSRPEQNSKGAESAN